MLFNSGTPPYSRFKYLLRILLARLYLRDRRKCISSIRLYEEKRAVEIYSTTNETVSDNDAANRLVELLGNGDFNVGKEVVNAFCSANGYNNTHLGRRFMDTNPADDNYTSSSDCRKILSDIYNGVCVNSEASEKMLQFLSAQTRKGKIPSGIPSGIQSANKTGEMPEGYGFGCIENDIAIVFGEQQDYVICILSNDLGGRNESAIERIRNISSYVYEVLK